MTAAGTGSRPGGQTGRRAPTVGHPRRGGRSTLAFASVGLVLAGCSLQVTKHGVSGNAFGHSFSGASGALPTGFPSDVPVPDHSRVLAGGGTGNTWDVSFAATGSTTSATASYQSKFRSAGYTVSNAASGSSPIPGGTGSNPSATSTTVTVAGSVFTAKNAHWTVEVVSGSTTSSTGGTLKPGEFAINITVLPTSSSTPST